MTREALNKKYFRAARIVDNVDTVLIVITLGGAAGGVVMLTTIVATPIVVPIGVSLFTGLLSKKGKCGVKKTTYKAEKHEKIKMIASTKLNTIASHISKALSHNKVIMRSFD